MSDTTSVPSAPADGTSAVAEVRLRTEFPVDAFDPSLPNCPVITVAGTVVPADLEKPIRDAAKAASVTIRKG